MPRKSINIKFILASLLPISFSFPLLRAFIVVYLRVIGFFSKMFSFICSRTLGICCSDLSALMGMMGIKSPVMLFRSREANVSFYSPENRKHFVCAEQFLQFSCTILRPYGKGERDGAMKIVALDLIFFKCAQIYF